jgi:hypothetical protein
MLVFLNNNLLLLIHCLFFLILDEIRTQNLQIYKSAMFLTL